MRIQIKTYYILIPLGILLLSCNPTDNKSEKKISPKIKKDSIQTTKYTTEAFIQFIDSIEITSLGERIFSNNGSKLQISDDLKEFIELPANIFNSLDSTSQKIYHNINHNSIYAQYKLSLSDSTITIIYSDNILHDLSFENQVNEFIVTYSKTGNILSFVPTKYTLQNQNIVEIAYTNFLENKKIGRYIAFLDTSKATNVHFYGCYAQEFYEIMSVSNNGKIILEKGRTNVLESFIGTFVKLHVVNNKFEAYQSCNGTFSTASFSYDSIQNRYLIKYKDNNREINFEIVSMWIDEHNNTKEYSDVYSGQYCYLTLLDLSINKIVGKLIMGQAGISSVTEFMWPSGYGDLRYYYTLNKNIENKNFSISKPDCK